MKRAGDGGGRQPLVPEHDRQRRSCGEIAPEGARGLRRRALRCRPCSAAGRRPGRRRRVWRRWLRQRHGIDAELPALERFQRRGDGQQRVGEREADGLLAQIEAEQACACRGAIAPPVSSTRREVDRWRHNAVYLCPISMRLPAGSRTKKRDRPSADAFFFDGDAMCRRPPLSRLREIGHQEADMAFALRADGSGSTPICICDRAHLEPGAAAGPQFLRLGDFGQAQNRRGRRRGIRASSALGTRDLDMVDAGNAERIYMRSVGPHLLASPAPGC